MSRTGGSTVSIIDDNLDIRMALHLLCTSAGLKVELHDNGYEFLESHNRDDEPGCIVSDIRMPVMGGLQLQEQLLVNDIFLPIIFLTGYADVSMAVRALKLGAVDFIEKPFRGEVLLGSIHKAIRLDAKRRYLKNYKQEIQARVAKITDRERQVLDKIIEGFSNKVIAIDLDISILTVETHRKHIMEKMEASNLSELVRMIALVDPSYLGRAGQEVISRDKVIGPICRKKLTLPPVSADLRQVEYAI